MKIKVRSAGIIRGRYPLDHLEKKVCKTAHVYLKGRPQGVSSRLLAWLDVLVIVADDVPAFLFEPIKKHDKKIVVWKIPDTKLRTAREIKTIVSAIKIHVDTLVNELSISDAR